MDNQVKAIKVNQWLSSWNDLEYKPEQKRPKPDPYFFMFSISAKALKKLSGVYRRQAKDRKSAAEEYGIQRKHDPDRSKVIKEYVLNGYPWSELSDSKRESGEFHDLKHPGWLPTAIVINILKAKDKRRGKSVNENDIISISDTSSNFPTIKLPNDFNVDNWHYKDLPPIEIIDGQHRLWAFEDPTFNEDYELPVVAFHGLGISWQAYLFYTINISPKKINRSLAFDLYPLLRSEEWLQKFEGHIIYRETRAQELVDLLFSNPNSPWYQWINMLGDTGGHKMLSQSGWIRSLLRTYVKKYEGRRIQIGGIYGAAKKQHDTVLPWGKEEQAALLIYIGNRLKKYINDYTKGWAKSLRDNSEQELPDNRDLAFYGKHSLLNQNQGLRGLLYITNDYLYINYEELNLEGVFTNQISGSEHEIINYNLDIIRKNDKLSNSLNEILKTLSKFDWRSYGAESLNEEREKIKRGYRGSGGYKALRIDLLDFIIKKIDSPHKETFETILKEVE